MRGVYARFRNATLAVFYCKRYLQLLCISILSAMLFVTLIKVSSAETIRGTVKLQGQEDARKVVIYVEKAPGEFIPPEKHPVMDQIELIFVPYVLPILIGTTVDFHNSDDVLDRKSV